MHSSTEGVSTDPVPGHFYCSANYTWQTCWPTQQAMAPTITTAAPGPCCPDVAAVSTLPSPFWLDVAVAAVSTLPSPFWLDVAVAADVAAVSTLPSPCWLDVAAAAPGPYWLDVAAAAPCS